MKPGIATFVSAILFATSSIVQAAPATQAEAQRLVSVFETYIGKGAGSGISPVGVAPRGEDYIVTLNFEQLAKPLAGFDVLFQMQPVTMILTPRSDGLWQVSQNGFPEFRLRLKDQDMKMQFEGLRFDGLFDPKIMAFKSGKTIHSGSTLESSAPNFLNTRRDGPSAIEMTGVESGAGAMSAAVRSISQSHAQLFRLSQGAGVTEINVTTGPITSDITIDSFRNAKIMDFWAFLVANPSEQALAGKFGDIKLMLRQSLPLFNVVRQTATLQKLSITSPIGPFGMRELGIGFNMTGVHKQGDFGMRMSLAGMTMPMQLLPAWSKDLVPSDLILDLKATGYDLEAASNEIIDALRPGVVPEESKAAGERAVYALAPDGKVKIALGPSRIVSKLLTITMEGEMTILKPNPKGRFVIKARGMDETIAALQAAAGSDPTAEKVLMFLPFVKGFGKAEPDGSLTWVVENPDGGFPTVNGMALPVRP